MGNLFGKAAVFTDLHLGLRSNSAIHNQDCEEYINWFIETAKLHNCDTGIFLGDYHHHKNILNVITMDYSLRCLEKLGNAFSQFFFLPGNHDLVYKDKRNIHSIGFGKYIPGITMIDSPVSIDNVVLCPWLVEEEWKSINKLKGQYIFGHFEIPSFFMNAMIQMPDHGEINLDHFKKYKLGFSGHFHKRQSQKNMCYIGNAFPHNFSDAGDDERGMMILEWGEEPIYKSWPNQPTFRAIKLSKLLNETDKIVKPNQHLKVSLDIDLSFEEASYIKEKFIEDYKIREFTMVQEKKSVELSQDTEIQSFHSIHQIVAENLTAIDSTTIDKNKLLEIYDKL